MGPSARLRAVQDLLAPLCEGPDFLPVDQAVSNYFRSRRYIGSKDKKAIKEGVYAILRCWQALGFALDGAKAPKTARNLVLAFMKINGWLENSLFEEGKYGLEPLSKEDQNWLAALEGKEELPDWAAVNCPEWLFLKFQMRFGKTLLSELEALNQRAGFDIRINTLKQKPWTFEKELGSLGFQPGKILKSALKSHEEINITSYNYYKNGNIEIQDEGSQLASLLVDAKPGQQVLDLCAGAGGKTLALAAGMQNKGQIFAYDILEKKLITLKARVQRAGVRNVQVVTKDGLKDSVGKMDRVLLDVPCSGTGTWRRSPDARLRLTPEKLETYKIQQRELLGQGLKMVKPGGRLVYVTCSLLPEENEAQIEAFLQENSGIKPIPYKEFEVAKGLKTLSPLDWTLQLSPGTHDTDGFFVAILEKSRA